MTLIHGQPCPKCGRTDDWPVGANAQTTSYPYNGETFDGIAIECVCGHKNDTIPVWKLEDIIFQLWKTGQLEEFLT